MDAGRGWIKTGGSAASTFCFTSIAGRGKCRARPRTGWENRAEPQVTKFVFASRFVRSFCKSCSSAEETERSDTGHDARVMTQGLCPARQGPSLPARVLLDFCVAVALNQSSLRSALERGPCCAGQSGSGIAGARPASASLPRRARFRSNWRKKAPRRCNSSRRRTRAGSTCSLSARKSPS